MSQEGTAATNWLHLQLCTQLLHAVVLPAHPLLLQAAALGRPGPVALLQQHTFGRDSCITFVETSFTTGKVTNSKIAHTPIACAHAWSKRYPVDTAACLSPISI